MARPPTKKGYRKDARLRLSATDQMHILDGLDAQLKTPLVEETKAEIEELRARVNSLY